MLFGKKPEGKTMGKKKDMAIAKTNTELGRAIQEIVEKAASRADKAAKKSAKKSAKVSDELPPAMEVKALPEAKPPKEAKPKMARKARIYHVDVFGYRVEKRFYEGAYPKFAVIAHNESGSKAVTQWTESATRAKATYNLNMNKEIRPWTVKSNIVELGDDSFIEIDVLVPIKAEKKAAETAMEVAQ
jgi:hypothetical protein